MALIPLSSMLSYNGFFKRPQGRAGLRLWLICSDSDLFDQTKVGDLFAITLC